MRLLFSAFLLIVTLSIYSKDEGEVEKRNYTTTKIDNAPRIDGHIDDDCWEQGTWDGSFTQQFPRTGGAPSQETLVKVLYDHDNIYVAIKSMDNEPDKIRRIFNSRDEFAGDVVGIAFDSYYDKRTAFGFNVTAAGQKIDLKYYGDKKTDENWNAIWDAATSLTDSGWVAEMRIPFSQLRYNKGEQQVWGMHVWRWIDREQEESHWQLIPQDASAMVYLFGGLNGIHHIRSSRQVELLPYASAKVEYKGDQDNPYIDKWQPSLNGGLDMKIGLSSNFTLDASINPDFGQVEADPSELNLTSYETFFNEKRPFFLEGREIFDFRINRDRLFYSRRVGSKPGYEPDTDDGEYAEIPNNTTILGSVKLTGRTSKGLSIGLMNSVTNKEYGDIYSANAVEEVSIEPFTNYFAGRVKQEANNANTIFGLSFNSVIRKNDENVFAENYTNNATTGGVDFTQYWKERKYFFTAKFAGSHIEGSENSMLTLQESHLHRFQRPDATHLELDSSRTTLSGSGLSLRIGKQGGQLKYGIKGSYWSPQFNINDIGYIRNADKIEQQAWINYESIESSGFFRKYEFEIDNKLNSTFGAEITENKFGIEAFGQAQNLWSSELRGELSLPSYDTRALRGGPALMEDAFAGASLELASNRAKNLSAYFYGGYWHSFTTSTNYYYYGSGINYNPADRVTLGLDINYERNYENHQYIEIIEGSNSEFSYMMGTLDRDILRTTLRIEYYITPEISIQYYGSPYFSVGDYTEFKRVEDAGAKSYLDRYYIYPTSDYFYDDEMGEYTFTEAGKDNLIMDNPDFSFGQFRSNLIFRWEYKLGSVIHFVWSHDQTRDSNMYNPKLNDSYSNFFVTSPRDVFMLKFSYWFSI